MAKSGLSTILPLIILTIVVGMAAVIGFVVYQIAVDVADKTSKKMEEKNVSFSKDGLKVGVKQVSAEQVGDSTQSVLIKAWKASSWPAYKSRLGWGQAKAGSPATTPGTGIEKRNSFFRTSSLQNTK